MRGAQAALSPNFGAPAMPAPWQAEQVDLKSSSPVVGAAEGAAVIVSVGLLLIGAVALYW